MLNHLILVSISNLEYESGSVVSRESLVGPRFRSKSRLKKFSSTLCMKLVIIFTFLKESLHLQPVRIRICLQQFKYLYENLLLYSFVILGNRNMSFLGGSPGYLRKATLHATCNLKLLFKPPRYIDAARWRDTMKADILDDDDREVKVEKT